jgi:hypothetical protein
MMAGQAGLAADFSLPDCIPPDSNVIFGMSLRSLLDSSVLKSFQSDMQKMSADLLKGGPFPGLEIAKSGPFQGFDPLKDVDDVLFASTAAKDKSTALIILHGRFDPAHLHGSWTSYNGVPIFGDAGQGAGAVAVLDESTAILGDLAEVQAAIRRRGAPSQMKPALTEQIREMAGRYDFWGVGDLPEGYQPSKGQADDLNSVDHFQFGASMRSGLEITGEIHARTPKDAAKMAESMKMVEAMLKSQPSSGNGTKVDLQSANGTIKLSVVISEEELKKGIETQKKAFAAGMNSAPRMVGASPALTTGAKTAPRPQATVVNNDRGETVKVTLPGGH